MVSALFTALALIAAGQAGPVTSEPGTAQVRSSGPGKALTAPSRERLATAAPRRR